MRLGTMSFAALVTAMVCACGSGSGGGGANGGSAGTGGSTGGTSATGGAGGGAGGAAAGAGGSGGAPLDPANYSKDCTVATDCIAVYFGDDACCGGCATHAIAKQAKPTYDADYAKFHSTCASAAPCPPISCAKTEAVCAQGQCSLVTCSPMCPSEQDGGFDGG